MKLKNPNAEIFVPDTKPVDEAIERTTHLGIAAHQDDIEIMAYDGILKCFSQKDKWFTGIVVTNGAGSPREKIYKDYTDEQMQEVRKSEQKKAAVLGEYSAACLLDYPSSAVKTPHNQDVFDEIKELITRAKPKILYTHNLADKHDTHVGVAVKVIKALRALPKELHPEKIYGCEVWRALDWINDDEKVMFDVSGQPNLASALVEIYDSQVSGGKRYDLATIGRRLANATYAESHGTDESDAYIYSMDLTPLINDPNLDIKKYVQGYITRFAQDVMEKIDKVL